MIVTVSVPLSSVTNIAGSKQEKSNITLFQTKIIESVPPDWAAFQFVEKVCLFIK